MIIPTPDFDPMFADDGVSFRKKMIAYIRREFPDMVDSRINQLETDIDLDDLSQGLVSRRDDETYRKNAA